MSGHVVQAWLAHGILETMRRGPGPDSLDL